MPHVDFSLPPHVLPVFDAMGLIDQPMFLVLVKADGSYRFGGLNSGH